MTDLDSFGNYVDPASVKLVEENLKQMAGEKSTLLEVVIPVSQVNSKEHFEISELKQYKSEKMKALKFTWQLTKILLKLTIDIAAIVFFAVGVVVTAFYIMSILQPDKF